MLNLRHAVRASLLQLPEKFTPELLFTTIAGLSYAGDIRIGLAEDPNKVRNIVAGSLGGFQELYTPILQVRGWWVDGSITRSLAG
jgi:translocator assembly and maintenance protein 41